MITCPVLLTLLPIKSVTNLESAVGSTEAPIPTNDFDPIKRSTSVQYGDGLNSWFVASIEFLIFVVVFCVFKFLKLSTKNPDLNLSNPFTSRILNDCVFASKRFKVVYVSRFLILSSSLEISFIWYLLWLRSWIDALFTSQRYGGRTADAISSASSSAFGGLGVSAGSPETSWSAPVFVRKMRSILPK